MDNDKTALRERLRATIEANKISRLPYDLREERLNTLKRELKRTKDPRKKEKLRTLISVINEKNEAEEEAMYNQTYAEYGGGYENGGGGSGTDNG